MPPKTIEDPISAYSKHCTHYDISYFESWLSLEQDVCDRKNKILAPMVILQEAINCGLSIGQTKISASRILGEFSITRDMADELERPDPDHARDRTLRIDDGLFAHVDTVGGHERRRSTIENYELLIHFYGITVKYNELTRAIEVRNPMTGGMENNDHYYAACQVLLEDVCVVNGLSSTRLSNVLPYIAFKHTYHPIKRWISRHSWDGKDRVKLLSETIITTNEHWHRDLKRWMTHALVTNLGLDPDHEVDLCLLMGSDDGHSAAEAWCAGFCPSQFQTTITPTGRGTNKENLVRQCYQSWIVQVMDLESGYNDRHKTLLNQLLRERQHPIQGNQYRRQNAFIGAIERQSFYEKFQDEKYLKIWAEETNPIKNMNLQQLWSQVLYQWENQEI